MSNTVSNIIKDKKATNDIAVLKEKKVVNGMNKIITGAERSLFIKLMRSSCIHCDMIKTQHWSPKLMKALFIYYYNFYHQINTKDYEAIKDGGGSGGDLKESEKVMINLFAKSFMKDYCNYLNIFNKFLVFKNEEKILYITCLEIRGGLVIIRTKVDFMIYEFDDDYVPEASKKLRESVYAYMKNINLKDDVIIIYKIS